MDDTKLLSVGIDIGTSTSQVIFSRLTLENTAGYFTVPSVAIIEKEVVYQSPVYHTPLIDESLIDGDALVRILEKEYETAAVTAGQVQTGAVIITGESARKENAKMVLDRMSRFAGDFVVSTAGPDLESVIAGQGSGAQRFSEENGAVVVNLDIGGGTTNVVLFDGGEVKSRGCLDIGGRQVTVDSQGRIAYISPSASKIAKACHLSVSTGDPADEKVLERLCDGMNDVLEQMLGVVPETSLLREVKTKGSEDFTLDPERPIRFVCFSGGVADCIYKPDKETFAYGDIGVILGNAIRRGRLFQAFRVMDAAETIRATVIGAGSYTTTISGSTIAYTNGLFPMKNVPVLKLTEAEEARCWKQDAEFVREKARWFLKQNDAAQMVFAIRGRDNPEYEDLKKLAAALTEGLDQALSPGTPLIIIVRMDIAKALGQLIRQKLAGRRPVLSVDEIHVEQNNFVDFGSPIMNGLVIPVVVKTLIFG